MKLLLTGSTGFVGRNFLLQALTKNYDEIVLPIRNRNKLEQQLKEEGISTIPASLKIIEASAPDWEMESQEVDHVVHCAGILFANDEATYMSTNVEGTLNLFRKLKSPMRIVVLSSQAAGGPCDDSKEARDEQDRDQPVTFYGKSKLSMEKKLAEEFSNYPYICLRPPMVLGPRDSATLPLFKMGSQLVQVKPGLGIKHYSFIDVSDLVSAIFRGLESNLEMTEDKTFYVASPKPITDLDLIGTAAQTCGRSPRIIRIPQGVVKIISTIVDAVPAWRNAVPTLSKDRAKEIWPDRWIVSPKKFQRQFNWRHEGTLSSVLKDTQNWYHAKGWV